MGKTQGFLKHCPDFIVSKITTDWDQKDEEGRKKEARGFRIGGTGMHERRKDSCGAVWVSYPYLDLLCKIPVRCQVGNNCFCQGSSKACFLEEASPQGGGSLKSIASGV